MNEDDVFLHEILIRPDDDEPRLIWADWLDDHDDPRAALLRLGWEQRCRPGASAARRAFREQLDTLGKEHGWVEYDGLVLTPEQFLLVFRFRLAETLAFCAGRDLPLRTERLDPQTLLGPFDPRDWPDSPGIDWPGLTLQLAIDRRRLLERAGRAPSRPASGLQGGRLLFFDPEATVADGQAATYSHGYFDTLNVPPWDTWVLQAPEPSPISRGVPPVFTPHYLIAWVPTRCLARARAGIEVNEEGSLRWLDQVDTPLVGRLRAAGLLR